MEEKIFNGNAEIAKMMGWFQEDGQPYTWYETGEVAIYVAYNTDSGHQKELPFHKDWNWLLKAKERIVMLTGKKISDESMNYLETFSYKVNVATLKDYNWEWKTYDEKDSTPIWLMFSVVAELSEEYNKTQEKDD